MVTPPARDGVSISPVFAVAAWFAATAAAVIGAAGLVSLAGYDVAESATWPLWLVGLTLVPLWLGLLAAVVLVSRRLGTGDLRRDFGLVVEPIDVVVGVPIGVVAQLVFVPVLYTPLYWIFGRFDVSADANELVGKASGWSILLLVVLVCVCAPVVEELFFRGLVMRSFQRRVSDGLALVASAVLFGLAHQQIPQLPALVLFGLIAGALAQRARRLGPAIFAHAGFNLATVAVLVANR